MIEAYFFDLDGTLADTEILWVEAMELLAREHGFDLSHEKALDVVYGLAWPDVYEQFRRHFPEVTWSFQEMEALLGKHFLQLRDSRDIRIEGSIALLHRLSTTHPVAIVSGSCRADVEAAVNVMNITDPIRFFLGHEDYHPGKPDPACYLKAAQMMGTPPERCVVFEDSTVGVSAAKDAGMYSVALARPGRPPQDYSRADLVLEDLAEYQADRLL